MPPLRPFQARAPRRSVTFLVIGTLAVVVLVGCAKDRTPDAASLGSRSMATRLLAPDANNSLSQWFDQQRHLSHLPYPLALGNRWAYVVHMTATITTDAGPQPPESFDDTLLDVISDVVVLDGRRYYVQSESFQRAMAPGIGALYYVRQDRTGLYERDLSVIALNAGGGSRAVAPLADRLVASVARMRTGASNPDAYRRAALELGQRVNRMLHPAPLAGSYDRSIGPPLSDLAMLRYPLYVGASWIVRDSPRFARHVTGRAPLEVPAGVFPAWRIEGLSELYGPNDRVAFWYGADGLLRIQIHAESNAVDNTGNIIGTVVFDSDQLLMNVVLHDPTPIRGYSAEDLGEQ